MKTSRSLTPQEVQQFIYNWQKTTLPNVAGLFFARNNLTGLNEKVISFKMDEQSLGELLAFKSLNPDTKPYLKLYLGCNDLNPNVLNDSPPFEPIIQVLDVIDSSGTNFNNCWSMEWDVTNNLLARSKTSEFASRIPEVGAYSFIYKWCQIEFAHVTAQFEGFTGAQVCRVKFNRYGKDDVAAITDFYNKYHNPPSGDRPNGEIMLYFHIGMGPGGNPLHPFTFSPILEIHFMPQIDLGGIGESMFFEFSQPCPPACGDE